jgi:hypothetical protein
MRELGTLGVGRSGAGVLLFFLSCDGKTKNNIWLSEPASDLAKISYKRKEKKQRDSMKKKKKKKSVPTINSQPKTKVSVATLMHDNRDKGAKRH